MDVMNFVKRFVPFVAAFAVGIFVASFFVDLRGPRLFRMDGNGHGRCRRQMRDYDRLERENYMLRRQLEEDRLSMPNRLEVPVPPPIPMAPEVGDSSFDPPAPRIEVHRHHPKR